MATKKATIISARLADFDGRSVADIYGKRMLCGRYITKSNKDIGPGGMMIIFMNTNNSFIQQNEFLDYHSAYWFYQVLHEAGLNLNTDDFDFPVYVTSVIKYALPFGKTSKSADKDLCIGVLADEVAMVKPRLIVCMGTKSLGAVTKSKYPISLVRGEVFKGTANGIDKTITRYLFATYDEGQINRDAKVRLQFIHEFKKAIDFCKLPESELDKPRYELPKTYIAHTLNEAKTAANKVLSTKSGVLVIDCEWEGKNWMEPGRYIRTVQIGYDPDETVIFEFRDEKNNYMSGSPDEEHKIFELINVILTQHKYGLVGHNIIADGEWLLSYGIDIRKHVIYDTMLGEYLINSQGPFGLDELSIKYTKYGRYCIDVDMWVHTHKKETQNGYGKIPRNILLPYSGLDVEVPRHIMCVQLPIIAERGYLDKRGMHKQYPSMLETTLRTQELTYELEATGLPVDRNRLNELITAYQGAKSKLLAELTEMATNLNFPDFSPTSSYDVRKLLFNILKLTPVQTTDGQAWGDKIGNMAMESDEEFSESTNKTTLEILQDEHPIVKQLLQFRRIDQVCKTWLKHADKDGNGGLEGLIWSDGRLHPRYVPMTETGRMRVSSPNSQNWPKKAESYLEEIFGKDNVPPMLRTIIAPPPGWCMLEGDFCQAELFTMASLSGDRDMKSALTTPGKDLHDMTAMKSFNIHMELPNGQIVEEEDLVNLAAMLKDQGGVENETFKNFQKSIIYVDGHGKRMTRDQFKSGVRVSAKSLNFGIPYGRGAKAIALQIKAETGDERDMSDIEAEVSKMIDAWKTTTFPTAWAYLQDCSSKVYSPEHYIENPWGRRKYAIINPGEHRPDLERQFGNFPIQSTVADTVQIAMDLMDQYRKKYGMKFKIQNQIHDAIMIELPETEIDQCKKMFKDTMGNIEVPVGGEFKTLTLDIDLDLYSRWGVKIKS